MTIARLKIDSMRDAYARVMLLEVRGLITRDQRNARLKLLEIEADALGISRVRLRKIIDEGIERASDILDELVASPSDTWQ